MEDRARQGGILRVVGNKRIEGLDFEVHGQGRVAVGQGRDRVSAGKSQIVDAFYGADGGALEDANDRRLARLFDPDRKEGVIDSGVAIDVVEDLPVDQPPLAVEPDAPRADSPQGEGQLVELLAPVDDRLARGGQRIEPGLVGGHPGGGRNVPDGGLSRPARQAKQYRTENNGWDDPKPNLG